MNLLIIILTIGLFVLIDSYVYGAFRTLSDKWNDFWRKGFTWFYWGLTALTIIGLIVFGILRAEVNEKVLRNFIMLIISMNYLPKFFAVVILAIDDVIKGIKWLIGVVSRNEKEALPGKPIKRSEFVAKAAVLGAGVPFFTMGFGILSGAHDYRIRRQTVKIKDLPANFDGIKIGQISDIHSGSFYNKTAVQGGIDLLNGEKPDIITFTGDLVNVQSSEVKDYVSIFSKTKADFGTFSVTGNHDYGDYRSWSSSKAKQKNFDDLVQAHKALGWDLLLNENRSIEVGNEKIALLGIENWGAGRFSKYGDLKKAYEGTEDHQTKILLSHDPSHWEYEVLKDYPDIDLSLAGHTHGFQFGVELGSLKWSPAQYRYKQWAGLYSEDHQHIYVNRGYGFIGYPGRIGMPPEITILTLEKA